MIQQLDKIQEAILAYDTYTPRGTYGVTSLETPRYRIMVEKANPGVDCSPLTNRVDSKLGTGFHAIAEEALNESDLKVETERVYTADIAGYEVGGTCDIVLYDDNDVATIADIKTMKAFPAKKALNGETDKFIKQLSLYAYMHRAAGGKTNKVGVIYGFVTGWTQRDKAIPKTFRLELELMSDEEVEAYVTERITMLDEVVETDCPSWMCKDYCGVRDVCPHYNNHEFKSA